MGRFDAMLGNPRFDPHGEIAAVMLGGAVVAALSRPKPLRSMVTFDAFDRAWWKGDAQKLAEGFSQEAIHVRAVHIEILDEDAV